MDKNFTLKKCSADTAGVSVTSHGISIRAELYGRESNGILLYGREETKPVRIDFTKEMKFGSTYHCMLSGVSPREYTYLFHEDGNPVMDFFAKQLVGHRLFGEAHRKAAGEDSLKACAFVSEKFDWRGDKRPGTAYEDSVYYGMHVRGFTKDASSRIKEAGTFAGVQKKIPYLKRLGVTGIVLQPVYEFEECMKRKECRTVEELSKQQAADQGMRLNYWGYLPGYYLAPKNAYSYGEDAVAELKTLVRQLHKNNIEVILQFYFEPSMPTLWIRDILLYWAKNYHIDGFELLGAALPLEEIALESGLSDCKLWSSSIPYEEVERARKARRLLRMPMGDLAERKSSGADRRMAQRDEARGAKQAFPKEERYLAGVEREYRNIVRRFLKGDGGVLAEFLRQQRNNPEGHGQINCLAAYNSLRLADVVSYERKNNEPNGEENRDGENENYSWNCGVEGETKKKHILALRMRLLKNALAMLFTAQGTPFLFMGDEYGKSADGNNNPWCQDNAVTWQKWALKKTEKELLAFTERMIALRREYAILRQKEPMRMMDYLSCGCPDLSYHGEEAWRTSMDYQTRHIGVMLCGKYCAADGKEEDLYIAYNMHWEPHEFALPKPFQRRWELLLDTDTGEDGADTAKEDGAVKEPALENPVKTPQKQKLPDSVNQWVVTLPARSVRIYRSVETPKMPKRRQGRT